VIRINLLPVREIEARAGRKVEALVGGVCLGLAFIAAAGVYGYQTWQLSRLEADLAELQNEVQRLSPAVKEVAELQKNVSALKEKNKVIDVLTKRRTGPVKIMEDLSAATPARLWLTEFKEMGGSVTINGFATDNQTVADFLKTLSRMPRFANVELLETIQSDQDGAALKKFVIKANVNYQVSMNSAAPPAESSAILQKP
jgi:type IV pilus assembly protein PilN